VTSEGHVALGRPDTRDVAIYSLDGQPVERLGVSPNLPLAIAADALGNLHVLVRPPDPADPSAALIVSFTASGRRTLTAGALGATPPPATAWPWALAASDDGLAFLTGEKRFQVHRTDPEGSPRAPILGTVVHPQFVPQPDDLRPTAALSLSPAPDGLLAVLDGREGRLVQFSREGESELEGAVPPDAVDLAVNELGERLVSTAGGRLLNYSRGDVITPTWEVACNCELGGRLAVVAQAVYVSRPRYQAVGVLDPIDGATVREIHYAPGVGLWPSDIVVGTDERLYAADLVTAQVQGWSAPAAPDTTWQAGLLAGPRRLASGYLPDGTAVIAAVMADGFVEIHTAAGGNLLSRWPAVLSDGTAFDPADIALDRTGRVFLADARARAVHVFTPGASVPQTPVPDPSATPTPSDRACIVRGDKQAGASTIVHGTSVTVTLSLAAECPAQTRVIGADIVLVMDRSGSMHRDKMAAAKGAARAFAELLDVRYHHLGLASFSNDASIDVPLTDSVATVVAAIEALSPDPQGQTNIAAAIDRAQANLRDFGRQEVLPVIVLLTDGQHNQGTDDPRLVAEAARNWGAQIYTIGLGSDVDAGMLVDLAGQADHYFFAPAPSELFPIYGQILRLVLSSLAGNLIVDDQLADDMTYMDGSAQPEALVSPGRLRWGRSILPASGITLSYRLRPETTGCQPTNRQAVADYTDGDGARRRFVFPLPTVCVIAPTPVPSATPTRAPSPIMLPILYRNHCRPGAAHADIVLLIDTSDSMSGAKLEQAKSAAIAFITFLDLPRDQAAVIGFDNVQEMAAPLTGNLQELERAIAGLSSGNGTFIDRALRAAMFELLSPRRKARNRGVVVLLSDGAHNGLPQDVLRASDDVRRIDATIYAIGLGADADGALLSAVAGPGRYYFAPEPEYLREIYEQIAVVIPCP